MLPEQIPRHFGFYGQADAYWQATLSRWLFLPIVALLSVVTLYGPAWVVGAVPSSWINVPNQEEYDALPPAKKRTVVTLVQRALYWMTTAALVIFLAVQASIYFVARASTNSLPVLGVGVIIASLLAIGGITGGLVCWLPKRVRSLSDELDNHGADPSQSDR